MKRIILLILPFLFIVFNSSYLSADNKKVIGWLEMVRVYPGNLKIRAKFDTGAKVSSLNASSLLKFNRNGESWVKFKLYAGEESFIIEKKILETVNIKKKGGCVEQRPVIKIGVCIGSTYREIEVNLIDRSSFNYQLLIGRNDSKEKYLIDPSLTFTSEPTCTLPPDSIDNTHKEKDTF